MRYLGNSCQIFIVLDRKLLEIPAFSYFKGAYCARRILKSQEIYQWLIHHDLLPKYGIVATKSFRLRSFFTRKIDRRRNTQKIQSRTFQKKLSVEDFLWIALSVRYFFDRSSTTIARLWAFIKSICSKIKIAQIYYSMKIIMFCLFLWVFPICTSHNFEMFFLSYPNQLISFSLVSFEILT